MQTFYVGLGFFIVTISIIELIKLSIKNSSKIKSSKIRKRIKKYTFNSGESSERNIIKKRVYSEVSFFNVILQHTPMVKKLDNLVLQANGRNSTGVYILIVIIFASVGFIVGNLLIKEFFLSMASMVIFGSMPVLYLMNMKRKRTEKFRRQLPDGLDLIARALKAGHAFTGGMNLAIDEFGDPLGTEFSTTVDEINFGVSVADALKNFARRIDCEELKYFVLGVILQRETGGNLSELIETLAFLIREKFKFELKVKALTAEGRISAVVLIILPISVAGYLFLMNPHFLEPLLSPIGKIMVLAAVVMMIIGALIMKHMVNIKV